MSEDVPVTGDPDPVESTDLDVLRGEVLRLREQLLAADGRTEVLRDRIADLEASEAALDQANRLLHEDLARNPLHRILRAVRRRVRAGRATP